MLTVQFLHPRCQPFIYSAAAVVVCTVITSRDVVIADCSSSQRQLVRVSPLQQSQ